MIAHGLLTFYRSLASHRLYAALNVLGLAIGFAVFLVLALVVRYEFSFDQWLPDIENVYRLDQTWLFAGRPPDEEAGSTFVAYELLRTDFPQIAAATRMLRRDSPTSAGHVFDSETVTYVDPEYLDVLRLPLVAGNRTRALAGASSVVITERIARKYFGATDVVGRTLDIAENGVKRSFNVSAVLRDLPSNTTLSVSLLTLLTPAIETGVEAFHSWGSDAGETLLRFRNSADATMVSAGLRDFVRRRAAGAGEDQEGAHPEREIALSLVRLPDAHFHDAALNTTPPGVDRRVVLSLGAIGVLALVMAAINTINLATARSSLRAREVALRKVMGATHRSLVIQYLGESLALVGLAALIGLALTELAVPVINALGGWSVQIEYREVLPVLLGVVVVVGLGSGLYPALLLAAYRPATVLAAVRSPAGGRLGAQLRQMLVLAQFATAIAFAVCTLVIDAQATLLRKADRGFDRQGMIIVQSLEAKELVGRQDAILDVLRAVPGVVSVTRSDREPDSDFSNNTNIGRPGLVGPAPALSREIVGRDYFATYGIQRIAGRLFDRAHPEDEFDADAAGDRLHSAVLNVKAVLALGFADPAAAIGHTVTEEADHPTQYEIVGVVQDVRFMSPREPVSPQFYVLDSHGFEFAKAAIRYRGVSATSMMLRLQTAWRAAAPENPFLAQTADERLADFYKPDEQRAQLFSLGALLALLIACLGLYGLASFNTTRRIREIGIRKTLGAATRDVLMLLLLQFIRPVLIANVLAWPLAWLVMRDWLSGFDVRVALSPAYFIFVSAAMVGLALATVFSQAWRVARAEPAKALQYE